MLVLILNHLVIAVNQLLKQHRVLLIDTVDHITGHKISVQFLDFLLILFLPLLLGFVNKSAPVHGVAHFPFLFLGILLLLLVDLSDFHVQLPVVLQVKFEVLVFFNISLPCHAQVFQGKITLLMNMPVVILTDFRWSNFVLRPYFF
jgi:hypothetical protein